MQMTEVQKILVELRQLDLDEPALLQKFKCAVRVDRKLACALHGFLRGDAEEEYIHYLLSRLRPAVTELLLSEELAGLAALGQYGVFTEALTEEFLKKAISCGAKESIVWFLRWKEHHFGFHDRDFSLSDSGLCWKEGSSQPTQGGGGSFGSGQRGHFSADFWEEFVLLEPNPKDYRPLLRKYMVPGEEIETDDESFDYAYYDFGMRQYGNLPLLEPLEYREVYRLDVLVIAIDTSSSCDSATVSRFLQEIYEILTLQENFFRRMQVVFFQCDCCLQDMVIIHSREEWLSYMWNIRIHGRGGTDYRPVFREIEVLRERGTLKKPRALLYFTDGDGAYPTEAADYEAVFILVGKTIHPELVPHWAVVKEII